MLGVYPVVLANVRLQSPNCNGFFFLGKPGCRPGEIREHEVSSKGNDNLQQWQRSAIVIAKASNRSSTESNLP